MNEGKGCLILHQRRVSDFGLSDVEKPNILFLPPKLNSIQLRTREHNEKAMEGQLIPTAIKDRHTIWLYPNHIDISKIEHQCLSFPSLKGLYWHYWDEVNNSDWDIHLYDKGPTGTQRPLIISSKESEKFRIVLSSLTLDWQKQRNLLENIMIYVVEGRHKTAILNDSTKTSVAFDYLIELLRSQKYPFRLYNIDQNLHTLRNNIENEIGTILKSSDFVLFSV